MRKKKRKNWTKGIITIALALVMIMALASPAPAADAAGKAKLNVRVTSPKKNVKMKGLKLTVHGKKNVQLNVKYGGRDVTAKAKYKSTNPKAVSVKKGKVTIRKAGNAVITVKYGGAAKKLRVAAGSHKWKAHKKTKTVSYNVSICNCGMILSDLCEVKYCEECMKHCYQPKDSCICSCKAKQHSINHVRNGEPSNQWLETRYKDVTYVDYYYCDCGAKKAGEPEPKGDDGY